MKEFNNYIAKVLDTEILDYSPVSGGDISAAYKIKTRAKDYFLKINPSPNASKMFKAEVKGLKAIAATNTIATPSVISLGIYEETSYLLLDYIDSKIPTDKDLNEFGTQLARLHALKMPYFGFSSKNFIGSLPQSNKQHKTWLDFYCEERLMPQLKMGLNSKLLKAIDVPSMTRLKNSLEPLLNQVEPSLLHGDLWAGNYIISKEGLPYLIDPAVYYGHSEVDIAMSRLFGGFGEAFYDAYFNKIPSTSLLEQRIDLYQLYFLLVHLNIFGRSYYSRVISLMKRYF